ncbi:hypothetical protein HKBW3S42_01595 [Candidatus Hakubella thermalkaliphila]|uniref:Polymerase nucleotidyl transferase domain-containing protein n=1 Tax=Candidatus Hakubella thermalkaliphila TaxID=2754717 RepID=A0A6V8NWZ9_9ACTN|nr:nucleotidyltransferase domain-containing protein [Candidatus Hakubella thermalkaliphila]GFP19759.1 hypothetical protein HKBW3S03_01263 [Candidatus Hakubella thermalkaliphila]GFP23290.1 hypothetical protein HKBW3S09_00757 [Candidatus Hakubella thermalkaliphila]GFP24772.1 hypothetical protein HKBW3S25_00209 [Candidatus Hakubella thermalkaliphila]GFP29687.1 hypothetical protein HKBW3S34_00607 [Candidatus Hakubella thermalkaliphila]GFP33261.1 hypothetical protein HKBW3S42_01595 [Candidatus Haku
MKKSVDDIRLILEDLKGELQKIYGRRLKSLFLYGSYARGDATEGSDIDILMLIENGEKRDVLERRRSKMISDICLKYDTLVSTLIVPENTFYEWELPLYLNIRREGVRL